MTLPEGYKVDFSKHRQNLAEASLEKMLSQHRNKPIMRRFVAALVGQAQKLYDSAVDMQESRALYGASGVELDVLGRVVGEPRGSLGYTEGGDTQYRIAIAMKALKNHAEACSVPELLFIIRQILGIDVSLIGVGPTQVELVVHDTITESQLRYLIDSATNERVDESYRIPYPATMSFRSVVFLPDGPDGWCRFDTEDRGFDSAPLAVGSRPQWIVPTPETPPGVKITPPLPRSGYASRATLHFSSQSPGALQFFFSLDGSEFRPATSPLLIESLATGQKTFRVFARAPSGLEGPIAQHSWRVYPPDVVWTQVSPQSSTSPTATFGFRVATGVDVPATFEGWLNGASLGVITSPYTLSGLTVGQQTFGVQATTVVGQGAITQHSWTVS